VDGLTEVLDLAGEYGVTLALQPMHRLFRDEWTFLNTLDDTLDILSRIDHPCLRMAFGTYHLWQEPRLCERLVELAPLLATVQISDWRTPRCDNDRVLPGDGVIPLREILALLEQGGYGGSYEVEIWSSELWKRDPFQLIEECRHRVASLFEEIRSTSSCTPAIPSARV
ncbi:MAG: sugar phosphate isomerase/epimerase, partial [Planctomycetaceae bacterium]|nr:sugar phosphate isomerase/epimerase [Planctomycetaceae bacterium]